MQRWIALGVLSVFLLVGGGGFAYWTYKQNRPNPVWVPLLINRELTDDKRQEMAIDLKEKLSKSEILNKVSSDLGLARKWNLPSDESAAQEIKKRLFVKIGEADSPEGKLPSINIGVEGSRRETAISGEIALRLMKDVWQLLGIKPPEEQSF